MKDKVTTIFEEETGRRTGNTTRQIDFAIQQLYKGKIVVARDHFYNATVINHRWLFNRIVERLKFEHRLDIMLDKKIIRVDKRHLEIELL